MLANIKNMLLYFGAHSTDIILAVVIMVSAVIVAIGILKPVAFNKIKNKHIRKAALSFSNVIGCYIFALVYFLMNDWNLKYYFLAGAALSVACIVTYWFYENTCFRNLIGLIGGIAINKILNLAKIALTADEVDQVKAEFEKASTELKSFTKQELKKTIHTTKEDKDLKGL